MSMESKNVSSEVRYAHGEGHTDLQFNYEKRTFITGGSDGEVRVWQVDNDEEPESYPVPQAVYSLVLQGNSYYVASESPDLKKFSLEDGSYEQSITKFTDSIYHIDCTNDGDLIAAGSGDFMIKLINLRDNSSQTFNGHEAPILSLSIDPRKKFLISSSCDGSVRIWKIENITTEKIFPDHHKKSNDFISSTTLCRMCWSSDGRYLGIPSKDAISIYNREKWDIQKTFSHENFSDISICSISTKTNFIAAANNHGIVLIWEIEDNSLLSVFNTGKLNCITSMAWNPWNLKEVCFCNNNGEFFQILIQKNSGKEKQVDYNKLFENFDFEDDEFENENNVPRRTESGQENMIENSQISPPNSTNALNYGLIDDAEIDDGEIDIDIGALKSKYEDRIFGKKVDEKVSNYSDEKSAQEIPSQKILTEEVEVQAPFQPGSTPLNFNQRYMVWNDIGIVTNNQSENTINVEFHDMALHHSLHIPNVHKYTMADLSSNALVFANCDFQETSSRLYCMYFNSSDSQKEWRYDMPTDEYIEAIAVGKSFCCAATSKNFCRLISLSGIQFHIFSTTGPVLCLCAMEYSLSIIHHNGMGISGDQFLKMHTGTVTSNFKLQYNGSPTSIALSPKSVVAWAGFSDEGNPSVVDSLGIIRIFSKNNEWLPICNTKTQAKGNSNYFVIGLNEIKQQIRSIFCKGSRYPTAFPRPTLAILPFALPYCDLSLKKNEIEEECFRTQMCHILLKDLFEQGFDTSTQLEVNNSNLQTQLLKLFAMAINANADSLATDLARLMPNNAILECSISYAAKKGKYDLSQKIINIMNEDSNHIEIQCQTKSKVLENRTPNPKILPLAHEQDSEEDIVTIKPKPLPSSVLEGRNPFKTKQKSSFDEGIDHVKSKRTKFDH